MAETDETKFDGDQPLPEDPAISLAHPFNTKDHVTYSEAMRLVGAKCSKGALVDLVNWLLADRKVAVAAGEAVANDLRAQLESSQREAAIQAGKLFEDDVELRAAEAHAAAMSAKLQASQQENYAMEARLKDATVEDARGVAMRLTRAEIGVVLSWGGVLTQPEARAGIAPGLLAKLRASPPQRGQ